MKDLTRLKRYSKMSETKEELNEWCFSNNPKILSKSRNVEELKEELYRKKECYEKTLEEKEKELKLKMHKM